MIEQELPRQKIDRYMTEEFPWMDGTPFGNIIRAALAALDEDHRKQPILRVEWCKCGEQSWPCSTKARHEQALARAIGVSE